MKDLPMRIAIVDDEEEIRNFLSTLLTTHNHSCTSFVGGREVMAAFGRDTFDMLIIDWNMRGMSGVDVIRWVRENVPGRIPIVMLTSRSDERDIVEGLQAGADDFIIKPEKASVIAARIEALLRRAAPDQIRPRVEAHGRYSFDTVAGTVELSGEKIDLTAKEFALALAFFRNPHRALSRAYLLETVWNSVADLPTRTMDVHVSRIRTKLKLSHENGFRIQTIFGFGYRFEACDGE
jgi:DNA-binding response OmpR family regulator